VAIGTGFECPPNVSPLPSLRRHTLDSVSLEHKPSSIEETVRVNLNDVCRQFKVDTFQQSSSLYYGSNSPILLTYPELDFYSPRGVDCYWAPMIYSNGHTPRWPNGHGPKVFAYMLDHDFTPYVLELLSRRGWPTLVVGGSESLAARKDTFPSTIQFASGPVDSQSTAQQCDFTVCYGGHGTICVTLLAGKPLLVLPTTVEQYLNGVAVRTIGAGELGQVGNAIHVGEMLDQLATAPSYNLAAQRFAIEHKPSSDQSSANQVANKLSMLATASSR
jgi:hypothetical protein